MKRNYIGLATTVHDPALAVVDSAGDVVFAEATERFLQNKRAWNCVPDNIFYSQAVIRDYCEKDAELVVAQSWSRQTLGAFRRARLLMPLWAKLMKAEQEDTVKTSMLLDGMIGMQESAGSHVAYPAGAAGPAKGIIKKFYNHHATHAAAACYGSPFDKAVCLVVDGYGQNFVSTAVFGYENGKLERRPGIKGSRWVSLGLYYQTLCSLCGFDPMKGEEWKVMGLAPYGRYDENIYRLLRSYMSVRNGRLAFGIGKFKGLSRLRREIGESRAGAADLAYNGQLYFGELMTAILRHVHGTGFSDNLVLTGGCALNSAYNGRILAETPFKRLFVPSAPADDGNAIGAALLAFHEDHSPRDPGRSQQTPYLGASMSPASLLNLERWGRLGSRESDGPKTIARAAELLAAGKILGWVQGRAEFGPRALGNRSILADPRSTDIKNRLNETVKFREEFRPFAPAILHEHGKEYFENYQESPYMERTLRFRKEVRHLVPGVVHVDGTGRLQTVKREWNRKFYDLIAAFKALTGIPLLLNTSFNTKDKPIIHSVEDAIAVFFTSGLDALVIEDKLFEK